VTQKIANSCPSYFLTPGAAENTGPENDGRKSRPKKVPDCNLKSDDQSVMI